MPFGSTSRSSPSSAGSFLDYEQILPSLERGDLIEICRDESIPPYKHWVIIEKIVNGQIVWCFHVVADPEMSEESIGTSKASIRYEPLSDILGNTISGRPSRCRVNNQKGIVEKKKKKMGQQWPNINLSVVFDKLHELKGKKVFYDLKKWNCEHYVTLWKYGVSWSSQVKDAYTTIAIGVSAVAIALFRMFMR